ncbi:MCE family protein [Mesorhizobium sp. ZC-5]|uniref:MlaD family protein n=1 Tax=Mesorhizobium sp. ZC-5 TaxID=2986066 RepID=UPI0021E85AAA|nr:MlaD family protein [Mesorhizobium sp. ZC-5]MCV3241404.1 MCE family protein [Mesorhizobium sp. ZC-5]
METKANYVIVGIFTLAAILAAFGFVYWTAAIGDRGETIELRVRIPGSASGLSRGSAVLFNGVKVGDVRRVFIDVDNPSVAIADTLVDRYTPITRSTQADIGLAGLTGQANIELKGAVSQEPNILDEAEANGTVAEIVANPSAVTNLLQTAQDIFKRADNVLSQLEGFVGDARGPLTQTVQNAQKFSDALAANADGVEKFLSSVSALSEELAGVSGKLDGTLDAAEQLLRSVDREKVATIVANVETFTKSLGDSSDELEKIIANVDTTVRSVNEFAGKASSTLEKVDNVVGAVDPATVRQVLADIGKASQTANRAAEDVAKVTDKFGDRAEDIDQIISDAKQLAQRLNQASVRVDGVLAKVDNLLGSGEAEGVMADASQTLKSFKQVADTLNSRLGTITDGFARFSNQGLREIEALARDSRRSINRIEEAVSDLERNPQRILSGGDGEVRQYDGRARR